MAWHLEQTNQEPYTGFDCSGFIWRILGMINCPKPWRNTKAMNQHYTKIASYDELEPGDLLWLPGHILIIEDVGENTIIEAR